MKNKMKVRIYIGKSLNRKEYIASLEIVKPYIPSSNKNSANINQFEKLEFLITYICDWFDVLKDFENKKDSFCAEIYVNNISSKKVLIGEQIINFLDSLQEKYKMK